MIRSHISVIILLTVIVVALFFVPIVIGAQEDDLRATIRSEIMKDPRSSTMTSAEIDAMVEALAEEANRQGMTSYDITWQPASESASDARAASTCGFPQFLCNMNRAFGFDGSDPTMPIALGVTSALLILLIGTILHHHHLHGTGSEAPFSPPQQ